MIVSIVAAMDRNRGIGAAGKLPWRLPADLKRFKALTMGHHVAVGRKTFESIGRLLPGRQMIIVTRDPAYKADGCLVTHSLEAAVELAAKRGETELMICGGGEIYRLALPIADKLYLTLVNAEVAADTFFPELCEGSLPDRDQCWVTDQTSDQTAEHPADHKNEFPFTFQTLTRASSGQLR